MEDNVLRVDHAQLGALLGLSVSGVSRIRSGHRAPSRETMLRVRKACGWPVGEQAEMLTYQGTAAYAAEFDRRLSEQVLALDASAG